jgi:lysophospholipase L1-like esterase
MKTNITHPTIITRSASIILACAIVFAAMPSGAGAVSALFQVPAASVITDAKGPPPSEPAAAGRFMLANEPENNIGAIIEFDLDTVSAGITPLARLRLENLEKLKVKRPGKPAGTERGALHVFAIDGAGRETLAGSTHVKPGGVTNTYTIDVTGAINAMLASPPPGGKKIRLAARLTGKPLYYEVYALSAAKPALEIAPADNWTDDARQCVAPLVSGQMVHRESCLALAETRDQEVTLRLLYPAKKITEVIALGSGQRLQQGRDWILRDGKLVLPAGTQAPVQLTPEFFLTPRKDKDGKVTMVRSAIKLAEGGWYHERQIAVSYEPEKRDWNWPAPISSLNQLPRTKQRLQSRAPLSVILFGDSISEGFNASKKDGLWPYQPAYGELVTRELERVYGGKITFMNHARAGGTSAHATTQVDAQVAWFKPDLVLLAYGMNDRSEQRRADYKANLEKIMDTIRARSPETEFVIITPMLNNPRQPTGLDPVKFIRDEALKIKKPGVAYVDITSTELAMLERKDYLDLSGNGANHPNDFLMRIYAQRILEVLSPQ